MMCERDVEVAIVHRARQFLIGGAAGEEVGAGMAGQVFPAGVSILATAASERSLSEKKTLWASMERLTSR